MSSEDVKVLVRALFVIWLAPAYFNPASTAIDYYACSFVMNLHILINARFAQGTFTHYIRMCKVIIINHLSLPHPVPLKMTPGAVKSRCIGMPQHIAGTGSSVIGIEISAVALHIWHLKSYFGIATPNYGCASSSRC
jgi:hypothetical protein